MPGWGSFQLIVDIPAFAVNTLANAGGSPRWSFWQWKVRHHDSDNRPIRHEAVQLSLQRIVPSCSIGF